jgi:hypothetical protein
MSKQGAGRRGWHITGTARSTGGRCLGCRRVIVYGERCEGCKQELRQRRKRKPR